VSAFRGLSRSALGRRFLAGGLLLIGSVSCTQSALVGDLYRPYDGGGSGSDAPGYIDGRVHAHAVFNTVSNIYWFGGANDPTRLEIYIYREPATCQEVSTTTWQDKLRPIDFMGITIGGVRPGSYPVTPDQPPAAGQAYVLHEIDQHVPVVNSIGQSGTVVITSVLPADKLTGTLDATFVTGRFTGEFTATWCATGLGL
jgi:hypothetical protein